MVVGMDIPGDPGQDLSALAAVVSRQSLDLNVYAGFLLESLVGALPPEQVTVMRKRSRFGRGKEDAPVLSVAVRLGERRFVLQRPSSTRLPQASIAHEVGGIVLNSEPMSLADWSAQLAVALGELARQNVEAAAALARITSFTV
jgi:hypothetical protein